MSIYRDIKWVCCVRLFLTFPIPACACPSLTTTGKFGVVSWKTEEGIPLVSQWQFLSPSSILAGKMNHHFLVKRGWSCRKTVNNIFSQVFKWFWNGGQASFLNSSNFKNYTCTYSVFWPVSVSLSLSFVLVPYFSCHCPHSLPIYTTCTSSFQCGHTAFQMCKMRLVSYFHKKKSLPNSYSNCN